MSAKRMKPLFLFLAALLFGFAVVLAAGYNSWAALLFVAAAISLVCAFPSARTTIAFLLAAIIGAWITWAILDGGAQAWTAIAPATGSMCSLVLAIRTIVRRNRNRESLAPRSGRSVARHR